MIEQLLKEHGGELLSSLTGAGGLDTDQAERMLPGAVGGIGEALSGGKVDLGEMLGGGSGAAASLLSKLDIEGIANSAGIDPGMAKTALGALVPVVINLLGSKAGGAEDLLSMLGGGGSGGVAGALGGLAGKLFKS